MSLSRHDEAQIRRVLEALQLKDSQGPQAVLDRLAHLDRALEPEDEFAMILTWLGRCQLVHKLRQEQLPLQSIDTFRVPDLFAAFDYRETTVPVLIEVKTSEPRDPRSLKSGKLSLKPHYLRYAELVGLPMLVAWRHRGFWTLFQMRHPKRGERNFRIDFSEAMEENLLGILAGDFSYRVVPGTAIRMRIRKMTPPDPGTGSFDGKIHDVHFSNANGERIPNIPHLSSIFMFWDNKLELVDDGPYLVQSFLIPHSPFAEFASKTLAKIVHSVAALRKEPVSWPAIIHDAKHLAHDRGRLRALVQEGAKYGVISNVINFRPKRLPSFLR
jgi:hypothetical protein